MGELYPASAVTTDFDFIKGVFIEFLETSNVSYESMSLWEAFLQAQYAENKA